MIGFTRKGPTKKHGSFASSTNKLTQEQAAVLDGFIIHLLHSGSTPTEALTMNTFGNRNNEHFALHDRHRRQP